MFPMKQPRAEALQQVENYLCRIASSQSISNPELQAQIIRNRLIRRIEYRRNLILRDQDYDESIKPSRSDAARSRNWIRFLVKLVNGKRGIGRRRGNRAPSQEEIVDEAKKAAADSNLLTPTEARAVELLCGARPRSKKNIIEERALQLAELVEQEWFPSQTFKGRPKGNWNRNTTSKHPPRTTDAILLTLNDIVVIALQIIEQFSNDKITRGSDSFKALLWTVRAECVSRTVPHRDLQLSEAAVYQAISRVRRELRETIEEVAPDT
jgi:hypothetical protein